jgi:hypothetical protein
VIIAAYPLLNVFWSMMFFFLWVAWIMLVFRVIADVFRRPDMSGLAKGVWLFLVLAVPFLGVLIYVVSQGGSMSRADRAY